MRIPGMLLSLEQAEKLNRRLLWTGRILGRIFYTVKYELARAGLEIAPEKYLTAAGISAFLYGIGFFLFFLVLLGIRTGIIGLAEAGSALLLGFFFFTVFLILHAVYPGLMSARYAAEIDQSLVFALKSILIQVSSGVTLFDAMNNASKAKYGSTARELGEVVRSISLGESETQALEKLALKTRSDYLKKTSWQMLSALRSGSSIQLTLKSVVESLNAQQLRTIRDYTAELNVWLLLYLLVATAIPTLGITFLVIFSAMANASIQPEHILTAVAIAAVMELVLIGLVKSRIPRTYQ